MELRYYQALAVDAAEAAVKTSRSTMIHGATGIGKTVIFTSLAKREANRGGRVLVLSHRIDLVNQAARSLERMGLDVGIEQGKTCSDGLEDVVSASVSTMRGKRLDRMETDSFSLIIVDEAHHGAAKSYVSILDHFASAKVIGVTATPWREDGRGLSHVFDSVCYSYPIKRAIDEGYLVPVRARRVTIKEVDLDGVKVSSGDFIGKHLDQSYCAEDALHAVADPLVDLAWDRSTIVFCAGVNHAASLADVINRKRPGSALMLCAKSTPEERDDGIRGFLSGSIQYLVNVGLYTEGTDLPKCSCVAIVRPTKSKTLYAQMLGRGTRLAHGSMNIEESIRNGKPDCLVIDFFGTTTKHKLAGAVSILSADDIPQDLVDEANALLEESDMGIDEAIQMAIPILEEKTQIKARKVAVDYVIEKVNPYIGKIDDGSDDQLIGQSTVSIQDQVKAMGDQIDQLISAGFSNVPEQLTFDQAEKILFRVAERKSAGLCTVKQSKLISKYGVDCVDVSKHEASILITHLKRSRWRCTRSELRAMIEDLRKPNKVKGNYERAIR